MQAGSRAVRKPARADLTLRASPPTPAMSEDADAPRGARREELSRRYPNVTQYCDGDAEDTMSLVVAQGSTSHHL
jgi:hypothetical protein